jgi:hypothetical protein
MKKTTYPLLAMTVFMVLFASACGVSAAPAAQPPVQIAPTEAAPVNAAAPVQQSAPAQTFAPACQASDSCAAPALKDTAANETYCVQKIPYQNILIDDGVTFQALSPDKLMCADNGTIVKGKHVLECHGTQLWTSQLKLTSSACGGSANLTTGSNQCQQGLGYDAAKNCCAPLTAADNGSVTIKINMGACP